MSGYQFFHIESYSRHGAVQKRQGRDGKISTVRKWSIWDIAEEAERTRGHCDHVDDPQPPRILYGCCPWDAANLAAEWASQAQDEKGRKLRKDGLCLLAGVASLPASRMSDWEGFRTATIEWLKNEYRERLVSVIEHLDEAHPHLHFYAVPNSEDRFDDLHAGRKAAAQVKKLGKKKGEQNSAYCSAMRDLQDRFYTEVGIRQGLARTGPGRRRATRFEWRVEQRTNMAIAKALRTGLPELFSDTDELSTLKAHYRSVKVREQHYETALQVAESREDELLARIQVLEQNIPKLCADKPDMLQRQSSATRKASPELELRQHRLVYVAT
ncbi:plasmid recombination protein [Chromobacterium vaccinii]|uniref:plasmid recombination protein n=1 Tax=Chromobacterium vaccinii TaxID=1108595 RepID=UPI000E1253D2|nr:plasmid recombination protein [Chromobacterium vaccinii]SUX54604.1 Uncharacterised protein [Chromobacterium vaccinii]